MRKVRCLYFLMSLFSLISLICIGFSSWTISGTGAEVMGTGGITASPVYDVDEYATCTSVECFTFNTNGFLNTSYGTIAPVKVTYTVTKLPPTGKSIVLYFRMTGFNGTDNQTPVALNNHNASITPLALGGYILTIDASNVKHVAYENTPLTMIWADFIDGAQLPEDDFDSSGAYHKIVLDSEGLTEGATVEIEYYFYCYTSDPNDTTYFENNTYPILARDVNENGTIDENAGEIATFYSHARIE